MIPGLKFGQDYYDDLLAKYTHKKELFLKGLDDLHIIHNDPEGAYYVLLDISEFGYDSDLKFCEDLTRLVAVLRETRAVRDCRDITPAWYFCRP